MPPSAVIKDGVLYKQGRRRHNWKERYFDLTSTKLAYYTDDQKRQLKGELLFQRNGKVEDVNVQITPQGSRKTGNSGASQWRFSVSAGGDSIMIAAPNEDIMNEWVLAVQRAVSNPKRVSVTNMSTSDLVGDMGLDGSDDDGDAAGGFRDTSASTGEQKPGSTPTFQSDRSTLVTILLCAMYTPSLTEWCERLASFQCQESRRPLEARAGQ